MDQFIFIQKLIFGIRIPKDVPAIRLALYINHLKIYNRRKLHPLKFYLYVNSRIKLKLTIDQLK